MYYTPLRTNKKDIVGKMFEGKEITKESETRKVYKDLGFYWSLHSPSLYNFLILLREKSLHRKVSMKG